MHTHAVGIVDHDPRSVALRDGDREVEQTLIPVHAEGAVAADQLAPGRIGDRVQLALEMHGIQMVEPDKGCLADPAAVEQRCMVQAILEDEVAHAQERVDHAHVGAVTAGVK